jgi:hypothetical protein
MADAVHLESPTGAASEEEQEDEEDDEVEEMQVEPLFPERLALANLR